MQCGDDAPGYVLLAYYTDIKQPIVASGLPGVFDGSGIKLRVAYHNLQCRCFDDAFVNLERGTECWIAEDMPGANKQITQDAKTFGGLLLDCVRNLAIHADA